MKQRILTLLAGMLFGAALFGGTTALASGILAEPSAQTFYLDGQKINLEAYSIGGGNYVKLRDVGRALDFGVSYDSATNSVQISSTEPYTEEKVVPAGVTVIPQSDAKLNLKEGDKVLCDDGYIYEITDMSWYDKSMFADGPLGDLPAPTYDWSRFPDTPLPDVEVRHFPHEDGDSMFIRNLHETRRMQYTLYNLIGSNTLTWNEGNPLATVNLALENSDLGHPFWPWRESELTKLFEFRPLSRYTVEAWDYYKGGIYQHTRYIVQSL
ncbi:MAG: hypothetical protein HFF18_14315 [Oscillospiraceae bacterium]|nr:hypothetical protein [Oscillospiraceae bacterium]